MTSFLQLLRFSEYVPQILLCLDLFPMRNITSKMKKKPSNVNKKVIDGVVKDDRVTKLKSFTTCLDLK